MAERVRTPACCFRLIVTGFVSIFALFLFYLPSLILSPLLLVNLSSYLHSYVPSFISSSIISFVTRLISLRLCSRSLIHFRSINDYLPTSPGIGMHVEIRDPDDKVLLSKQYSSEGRFTFTSHLPGLFYLLDISWSFW